jgi:hypothetical protein
LVDIEDSKRMWKKQQDSIKKHFWKTYKVIIHTKIQRNKNLIVVEIEEKRNVRQKGRMHHWVVCK